MHIFYVISRIYNASHLRRTCRPPFRKSVHRVKPNWVFIEISLIVRLITAPPHLIASLLGEGQQSGNYSDLSIFLTLDAPIEIIQPQHFRLGLNSINMINEIQLKAFNKCSYHDKSYITRARSSQICQN